MSNRPHIAAVVENFVSARIERLLRRRGWSERLIGFTGYGSEEQARVLARVVLGRQEDADGEAAADASASAQELEEAETAQRGWRAFITAPAIGSPVRIRLGEAEVGVCTDRGGNIDAVVTGHRLGPGWHEATLSAANGTTVHSAVQIIDRSVTRGVVSDIDDTVMITHLPRMLIAGWNTFVRSEQAREVVPGMAALMRSLLAEQPGAPIFYLSTGAWNTAPTLARFLRRHDYPSGPMLLTDWGPAGSAAASSTRRTSCTGCCGSSPASGGRWSVTTGSTTRRSTASSRPSTPRPWTWSPSGS
jgi:phosphatidate phosphatase APP1